MPWYLWGLIIVIFGSVIGSLLWLKNSANKMPIDPDKLERMKERNAELEAEEQAKQQQD